MLLSFFFFVSVKVILIAGARISDSTLEFSFLRSQCVENKFVDLSLNKTVGDLLISSTSTCLPSNGLGNKVSAQSQYNISKLIPTVGSGSYTIELWFQPQLTSADNGPGVIMMIGIKDRNPLIDGTYYHLQLLQYAYISTGPSSGKTSICLAVGARNVVSENVLCFQNVPFQVTNSSRGLMASTVHAVATMTFQSTVSFGAKTNYAFANFTINGVYNSSDYVPALPTAGNPPLDFHATKSWLPSDYLRIMPRMTLFTDYRTEFKGTVHYLAVYNRALAYHEILQNYQAKLPNSLPICNNKTITILENGEVGDHTSDPAFYNHPIPSAELAVIPLSVYDFDEQTVSANYVEGQVKHAVVYITSLPSQGTLYYLNGTQLPTAVRGSSIVRIRVPYDSTTATGYAVRYRPPLNVYSTVSTPIIARISFTAVDGVTLEPSVETASVSIKVTHVNKPPVPTPNLVKQVVPLQTTIISLTGTDSDSTIVSATVLTAPGIGQLFRVSANGSVTNEVLMRYSGVGGLPQQSVTLTGSYPIKVAYRYSGFEQLLNYSSEIITTDSFMFRLIDSEGRSGVSDAVNITVMTAIYATSSALTVSKPTNANSGRLSNITVYGTDTAAIKRDLKVRILRPPTHGVLYNGAAFNGGGIGSVAIGYEYLNSISKAGNNKGLNIAYLSNPYYFSHPTVYANGTAMSSVQSVDSFEYMFYAATGVTAMSSKKTQFINVKNVNDPTNITYVGLTAGGFTISAFTASGTNTQALFTGFKLTDPDRGVDYIRAVVKCESGRGQIHLGSNRAGIDFNSATRCLTKTNTWSCTGDGYGDATMSFVGTPDQIQTALQGAYYMSFNKNFNDFVTVTLYDGEGGNCLSNAQLGSGSLRDGQCLVTEISIPITISGFEQMNVGTDSTSTSSITQPLMITGLVAAVAFVILLAKFLWWLRNRIVASNKRKKEQANGTYEPTNKVVKLVMQHDKYAEANVYAYIEAAARADPDNKHCQAALRGIEALRAISAKELKSLGVPEYKFPKKCKSIKVAKSGSKHKSPSIPSRKESTRHAQSQSTLSSPHHTAATLATEHEVRDAEYFTPPVFTHPEHSPPLQHQHQWRQYTPEHYDVNSYPVNTTTMFTTPERMSSPQSMHTTTTSPPMSNDSRRHNGRGSLQFPAMVSHVQMRDNARQQYQAHQQQQQMQQQQYMAAQQAHLRGNTSHRVLTPPSVSHTSPPQAHQSEYLEETRRSESPQRTAVSPSRQQQSSSSSYRKHTPSSSTHHHHRSPPY